MFAERRKEQEQMLAEWRREAEADRWALLGSSSAEIHRARFEESGVSIKEWEERVSSAFSWETNRIENEAAEEDRREQRSAAESLEWRAQGRADDVLRNIGQGQSGDRLHGRSVSRAREELRGAEYQTGNPRRKRRRDEMRMAKESVRHREDLAFQQMSRWPEAVVE